MATVADQYYDNNHHTPHEFHVEPSEVSNKYLVRNALRLTLCVHDDITTAIQCAEGPGCQRRNR